MANITQKESAVRENAALSDKAVDATGLLLKTVLAMLEKRGSIFIDWLGFMSKYLVDETRFDPRRNRKYSRGDVILVHFGFNVGNEMGGPHPSVVIEDNRKGDGCVVVVPMSTVKYDRSGNMVPLNPKSDVLLDGAMPVLSYARVNQIRAVSKLRILKPITEEDFGRRIPDNLMDLIDEKIRERFTLVRESIAEGEVAASAQLPLDRQGNL